MEHNFNHEAAIPNPALKLLGLLLGEWETIGSHPYLPNLVLHGHTSFQWMEGGAFMIMHSEIDEEGVPSGIAVFGSDDATGEYFMLYFDERSISRKYNVEFNNHTMTWWRNTHDFYQKCTCIISDDGNTIISKGLLSRDNKNWENDLELTYTRIKK